MPTTLIRHAVEADFERIVELNRVEVQQTSPMDLERLHALDRLSSYHTVALHDGRLAGFLLTVSHGAAYRNDNYEWFAGRYPRFLYVDRIVVGRDFGGKKIGSALYGEMFTHARAQAIPLIACEFNIEPANPASEAFHRKFGFSERGTQRVADGTKLVSLQAVET